MNARNLRRYIETAKRRLLEEELDSRKKHLVRPLADSYLPAKKQCTVDSSEDKLAVVGGQCAGDQTRARLYAALAQIDTLDYPRSHHQRRFHECFIKASLKTIYGDDYQVCEPRLKQEHKCDRLKTEVMIVTPRRFGKTFSVAQYVAAFTAAVHGKEVAIFSTGRRASKKMLDLVMRFLMPLIDGKKRIITRNVEEILLKDEATGLNNKICSYPAKVQVRHPTTDVFTLHKCLAHQKCVASGATDRNYVRTYKYRYGRPAR